MADPWNEDLARLLPLTPEGADSVELSSAMNSFLAAWNADPRSDADLDAAVTNIAIALSWDLGKALQALVRFRQEATEESLNEFKPSFIGSKEQHLFGNVVGEVLDMPAVFAALLSPTGGMVGPGGFSFHVKGGVLGYHGVAHDAGGYLCRRHNVNPGYEYIVDPSSPPCEDSPLAGQISGIAFWFKLLNLGWLNFLAISDPASISRAPVEDISSFLEPGPLSISGTPTADEGETDGVTLNPAEVSFLRALITREIDSASEPLVDQGFKSLQNRGLAAGSEQTGVEISDQLIMAIAVFLEPQLKLEATPAGIAADEHGLSFYKWGDYIVEQTSPAPNQIWLAGLRDMGHAQERLLKLMPMADSGLAEISLSLTEDEFETAVSTAATAEIEPGSGLGVDANSGGSAVPGAVGDLTTALDSGQVMGTIRVQQFDKRSVAKTRSIQLIQGSHATWLVSRDSDQEDRVGISLASPNTIGKELGLSASTGS